MYQLPFMHKRVLGYICTATANERYMRGIDILLETLRDIDNTTVWDVMNTTNELVFLGVVYTQRSEQWQADTYHATDMGFSYNQGSILDREVK